MVPRLGTAAPSVTGATVVTGWSSWMSATSSRTLSPLLVRQFGCRANCTGLRVTPPTDQPPSSSRLLPFTQWPAVRMRSGATSVPPQLPEANHDTLSGAIGSPPTTAPAGAAAVRTAAQVASAAVSFRGMAEQLARARHAAPSCQPVSRGGYSGTFRRCPNTP
jgi:hypothetical protein